MAFTNVHKVRLSHGRPMSNRQQGRQGSFDAQIKPNEQHRTPGTLAFKSHIFCFVRFKSMLLLCRNKLHKLLSSYLFCTGQFLYHNLSSIHYLTICQSVYLSISCLHQSFSDLASCSLVSLISCADPLILCFSSSLTLG